MLDGLPEGRGLNIAHEAVDRHVLHGRGEHVALRWIAKSGAVEDFSYRRLAAQSSAFANVLETLGVVAGERVFVLSDRIPELYIAALGTLKHRNVFCPMFSAFGPEPIHSRMSIGDARVLVTTARLYRRKVAEIRDRLPGLASTCSSSLTTAQRGCPTVAAICARCWPPRTNASRFRRPIRKIRRCCISRAAPPASRKARCTCTARY